MWNNFLDYFKCTVCTANIICSKNFFKQDALEAAAVPITLAPKCRKKEKTTKKQRRFEKYLRGYLSEKHKEAKCDLKLFRLLSIVQYRINQENLRIFFRRLLMALKASSKVKKNIRSMGLVKLRGKALGWVGGPFMCWRGCSSHEDH